MLRDTGLFFPIDPWRRCRPWRHGCNPRHSGTSADAVSGTMKDNILGMEVERPPMGRIIRTGERARKAHLPAHRI